MHVLLTSVLIKMGIRFQNVEILMTVLCMHVQILRTLTQKDDLPAQGGRPLGGQYQDAFDRP